ncbi:MAG: hypothetical protein REI09_04935 [Candidatus Dactylopiibacterium sp.]|nr:hypothetical protein [Candidatus Dactylopiibacterium sp.]
MSSSLASPIAAPSSTPLTGLGLTALVREHLQPQLAGFCTRLLAEGRAMRIDGTAVFNGGDKFLPGKIAMGLSYLLLDPAHDAPTRERLCADFARIARLTLEDDNHSWGIYYYLAALHRLNQGGLLEAAVDAPTLARLAARLDWRRFVRETDFTLIDLPTNYYGVAFSIARLRHLLGWESEAAGEILLRRTLDHYRTYSGEFGFSDETEGEGRFDRYSILLIGEICQRCLETGLALDDALKTWLRRAIDVILLRLNPAGDGFDFGRSIGPYGDTAFLEVLAAGAAAGLLSEDERTLAYGFAVCATRKYVRFWFDAGTHSVNLWDKGRRTDAYRGKHRILGENFSLLHQYCYTARQWQALGYGDAPETADMAARLVRLPRFATTWFARGEFDRALITVRDGARILSLPVINGGHGQHAHNPYFSIPFCNGLVQGAADAGWPQLLPRITLADGSALIPAAWQRALQVEQDGDTLCVRFHQDALDRLGDAAPQRDTRLAVTTTYRFTPGRVEREDHFTPAAPLDHARIELEFASFSQHARVTATGTVFADGLARAFRVEGLPPGRVVDVSADPLYRAAMGPLPRCVRHAAEGLTLAEPFTLRWTLEYARD